MRPVVFPALASVSMGPLGRIDKVAAGYVNQLLGAILPSVTGPPAKLIGEKVEMHLRVARRYLR